MSENEGKVLIAIKRMTTAFEAGDVDQVLSAYEPGASVLFEPGRAVSDQHVMRASFAQWSALSPQFEYSGHEVLVAGGLALHLAPWTMRGRGPDGRAVEQRGLSVAVLRRQVTGEWLIVIDNPHGQRLITPSAVGGE